jgi:4-hydroxy-2-oxoheptanedioate aldolase
MRPNKLKELLKAGKPTIGTHLHTTWPSVVEAVGHTGVFDYVEFCAEYAPFDLYALDNFCRAAELHGMSSMIKVDAQPRQFLAQRAIGSGFQSVLFADCRTVEDAQECIQAVRPDVPEVGGQHGVAMRRFTYMGYGGGPDYVDYLNDVVIALMVEKGPAVDNLEEILSLGNIDMVQWGPSDFSMSVGKPGQGKTPPFKEIERQVIETCLRMGVPPRAEINSPDEAAYYLDLGVRHFCIGTDINILFGWFKDNGDGLRKLVEDA